MMFEDKLENLIERMVSNGSLKTPKIIEAFREVPRHLFVPQSHRKHAYSDYALPTIGESTISQPSTVALMTEALEPKEGEKILEIGAGSGWQACILGHCVGERGKVISVEFDEKVAEFAKKNITKTKLKNVKIIHADGNKGHPSEAPYDSCIITAATPDIPKPIVEQLKVGGRIVAPVGPSEWCQMTVFKKTDNELKKHKVSNLSFAFVPLK